MGVMVRVLIVLAVLVMPVAAFAQGKIGIINLDDALSNSSAGKAALSGLKSKFESREKSIAAQGEDLKKMQDELQKKSVALSQDAMKSKAADFEGKTYLTDSEAFADSGRERFADVLSGLTAGERVACAAGSALREGDRLAGAAQ